MIICYIALEICHIVDVIIIFHFGLFLLFYPLSSPKNENLKTMKKGLKTISFYRSVPKIMIICYTVPEIYSA